MKGGFMGDGRPDGAQPAPAPRLGPATRMWHVTLSVAGAPVTLAGIRGALERLCLEQPFLLCGRYAVDHAEVRYWEEAADVGDAAALGLRLWGEHRVSAQLPPWIIAGLEVVDRDTARRRNMRPTAVGLVPAGLVRPF